MATTLVQDLRAILGARAVSTEPELLTRMSHDAWPVSVVDDKRDVHDYRPEVVVHVAARDDVSKALAVAAEHGAPLTARGLGSSVTGQPLPVRGGVLLDMSGLTGEPVLDEVNAIVTAAAGCRGSEVEEWLNARGYTLNHFPQSLPRSTVGGWVATRATGQLSSRYGGIEDLLVGCTVVLSDGTSVALGAKPRGAVGPNLQQLFLGSEGCLGVVVDVRLKVFPLAEHQVLEAFLLPSVRAGLDALRAAFQRGLRPALVRLYDEVETRHAVPGLDRSGCALFLSTDGPEAVAAAEHAAVVAEVVARGGSSLGSAPVLAWLDRRFDFSTVERLLAEPGGYAETIEVAHLWSDIEALYDDLVAQLTPLADEVLGHFSHVYAQGASLYVIVLGRAPDDAEAAARLAEIWQTAMEVTLKHDGELSHHHGAGLARQAFIPAALGAGHDVLRRVKDALDPQGILNPGKLGLP